MIRRSTRGPGVLALALFAAVSVACGSEVAPSTDPPPAPVTETFTGTLAPNDAETHPFGAGRGTVTATLVTLAPDSTATVGFSLGTWNGISCAVILANDKATQGTSILGSVNSIGNLCVRMYDIGTIVDTFTYEVRVVHN